MHKQEEACLGPQGSIRQHHWLCHELDLEPSLVNSLVKTALIEPLGPGYGIFSCFSELNDGAQRQCSAPTHAKLQVRLQRKHAVERRTDHCEYC